VRTAKFGARIRKLADAADATRKAWHECPKCRKRKLKHGQTYAVWKCRSCGATIAGGAYSPHTEGGEIAMRLSGTFSK